MECYQCQFDTFQFSTDDTLANSYGGSAGIILSLTCNANTPLSAGCTTGVTITPSTGTFEAGDELSCSADGYNPTYLWTGTAGVNGATVSETGDEYTLPEGPFSVNCAATVGQLSCRDFATVSDTAYSMYQYSSDNIK